MFRRWSLLRPSVIASIVVHLVIQWPAAIWTELPQWLLWIPSDFLLLCHLVPLLTLSGAFLFGNASARAAWRRMDAAAQLPASSFRVPITLKLEAGNCA